MDQTNAVCAVHADRPGVFVCERCGNFGCADCAFWPGVARCKTCSREGLGEPVPWERRKELGAVRAAWLTARASILEPKALFNTPSIVHEGSAEPLLFAMAMYGFSLTITYTVVALMMVLVAVFSGTREGGSEALAFAGLAICYPLMGLVLGPPMGAMSSAMMTGIHWLGLRMIGHRSRYMVLLRAEAYSTGPLVMSALPYLGFIVGSMWRMYTEIIASRETNRISTGQAFAAVWIPRFVLGLVFIVPFVALAILLETSNK